MCIMDFNFVSRVITHIVSLITFIRCTESQKIVQANNIKLSIENKIELSDNLKLLGSNRNNA